MEQSLRFWVSLVVRGYSCTTGQYLEFPLWSSKPTKWEEKFRITENSNTPPTIYARIVPTDLNNSKEHLKERITLAWFMLFQTALLQPGEYEVFPLHAYYHILKQDEKTAITPINIYFLSLLCFSIHIFFPPHFSVSFSSSLSCCRFLLTWNVNCNEHSYGRLPLL